ncbi:MAG: hypothetical protein AAB964_00090, partial [Patescibacteria group bacterium]
VQGITLEEEGAFTWLVRPVKNPQLSQYFTGLTGVTQEMVERQGTSYGDALGQFAAWSQGLSLYCWGMDLEIINFNAKLLGICFPISQAQKRDVRSIFELEGVVTMAYMSSTIPRAFGEEPPPSAHDALNDARSILQGLRALRRRVS